MKGKWKDKSQKDKMEYLSAVQLLYITGIVIWNNEYSG